MKDGKEEVRPVAPKKIRAQYSLSTETVLRLRTHCAMSQTREAVVVEKAVLELLAAEGLGQKNFSIYG